MTKPHNTIGHGISLSQSKRLASLLLLGTVLTWIGLLLIAKAFPTQQTWLHILILGAEAGMVGGLADWYAVTVLFRDPFKRVWVPGFIREHTAIIARNKPRIALSMGKFVQENFMASEVVAQQIAKHDVTLYMANWLKKSDNNAVLCKEAQRLAPRILHIFSNPEIGAFWRSTLVDWLSKTSLSAPTANIMHAMLDNGLHKDVFQLLIESTNKWVQNNPEETDKILEGIIEQTGMFSFFPKAAALLGLDVKKTAVEAFIKTLDDVASNPHHTIRVMFADSVNQWTYALTDPSSEASVSLEEIKYTLSNSPTIVNFAAQMIDHVRVSVITNLESVDSSISANLQALLDRVADQLVTSSELRAAFNKEIIELCRYLADRYAETIISYVQTQIVEWDTQAMIEKIETEVGADLQMIRVNGVVVGTCIGLLLGVIRFFIER